MTENHHSSLKEIAAELSESRESIRTILNDCLGMKRIAAQLVPKDLNFLQKLNRVKAKNSTNIIEQLPYSPDMAPADIFLFPKLKLPLRGTRFQSIEDVKENSRRELKSIPENAFEKCFDDWIIRWHKCIILGGAYFEHVCYYIDPKSIEFLFIMLFWHWVRFILFAHSNYQWQIYKKP